MEAIINSTDAGYAVRRADALAVGDVVVDVYGGRHTITRLFVYRNGDIKITRDDGWVDVFPLDCPVTVA